MKEDLRYHFPMKGLKLASVAGFGLFLFWALTGAAQINGVPASVTSIGFGGHAGPHGVPPSVTSIGPQGIVPKNSQFPVPGTCCINPLFPSNPNPVDHHHHHHHNNGGYVYAVPYAVPYYAEDQNAEPAAEEPYEGGPTIFDRRGPGQPAPYSPQYQVSQNVAPAPVSQPSSEPASDQPQTVLVFRDGHQLEVSNYAIVGNTLYDLTPGHSRKVLLADLNLGATAQQNDDRGITFELPKDPGVN